LVRVLLPVVVHLVSISLLLYIRMKQICFTFCDSTFLVADDVIGTAVVGAVLCTIDGSIIIRVVVVVELAVVVQSLVLSLVLGLRVVSSVMNFDVEVVLLLL
jgi:hypothetical protein